MLENACAECSKACFQSAQEHVFTRVVMVLTLVYSKDPACGMYLKLDIIYIYIVRSTRSNAKFFFFQ